MEDTYYPNAHIESTSVDGRVVAYVAAGTSYASLRARTGDLAYDYEDSFYSVAIYPDSTTDEFTQINRGIFLFDTSPMGAGATISAATFSIKGYGKVDGMSITPDINLYASNPAANTSLTAADFSTLGSTAFCDTPITYAGWSTSLYNAFALNASGLAAISTTGITKLGTRNANYDASGTPPTWSNTSASGMGSYGAEVAGTASDPKLVITYTAAAGTVIPVFMAQYRQRWN